MQTDFNWVWQNMSFMYEYRKFRERKSYTEKSCTETIQILDFHSEYFIQEIEKLDFHLPHAYILGKIIVQVKDTKYLWFDTISLTTNAHVIMQNYVRYLVNKFTHNTSLFVSPFLWRYLHLSTLTNWNHPPHQREHFIIIYLMKVIRIRALLQQIFGFVLKRFLQNKWYMYSWQPCGIIRMVRISSIVTH